MRFWKNVLSGRPTALIVTGVLLLAFLLILSLQPIDAIMAYMFRQTEQISNVLEPAEVLVDVEETFDGQTKSNVFVSNHSNIPVYIRVILVEYWEKDGAYVPKPDGGAVDIDMGGSGWLKSGNMYYYTVPVAVDGRTAVLINKATATLPEGYTYHLDVHAEAIQAKPPEAVTDAWHVTLDADTITAVS